MRFSTVGTGNIVEKMINGGKLCEDFELYGVYSRSEERGSAFAKRFGASGVFTDFKALAESKTDAVYIASPTALHYKQAKFLLMHKKHVLCEKPACSNFFELDDLLNTAERNKVIYLEAMRPVFSPGYAWIKENLHKIGKIRHAVFTYCQYSSRYDNFKNGIIENAFKSELSNGSLMDIGVYPLHLAVSLFGKPAEVHSNAIILDKSIDGCGSAVLKYSDFITVVNYSKISDSKLPCEIQGENGTMLFSPAGTPVKAEIRYRNGEIEEADIQTLDWDLFYEIQAFCDMVAGKRDYKEYNQYTSDTIQLMDFIRRQCEITFPADKF